MPAAAPVVVAIAAASAALSVASFTLFVTAPWLRPELRRAERALRACRLESRDLRRQVAVIFTALIAGMPGEERAKLLVQLDELTPPPPRSILDGVDDDDDEVD